MAALEGVLPWLPVVLALSANSPFLAGEETGLMSSRAEVLAQLPRAGAPPVFRDEVIGGRKRGQRAAAAYRRRDAARF